MRTAAADRACGVMVPGKIISTGGHTERCGALLFDLAERHYRAAAEATAVGPWATAKGFGDGLIHAFAVLARIERHEAEALFVRRVGVAAWALAGPPPGYVPPSNSRIPGQRTLDEELHHLEAIRATVNTAAV